MNVDLLDLETAIKDLPGVLGCVIFSGPDGTPSEVQAFIGKGVDRSAVQRAITEEVGKRGIDGSLRRVFVFELETESLLGDSTMFDLSGELEAGAAADDAVAALERRASSVTGRPAFRRVVLSSGDVGAEAEVVLEGSVGRAEGKKTAHGLQVVAQATLEAVHQMLGEERFVLQDAALVSSTAGRAVLVFVDAGTERLVGAALVREGPVSEVAVRATLDAVNRRLGPSVG